MLIFIKIVITVGVLILIGLPYFIKPLQEKQALSTSDSDRQRLLHHKESIYAALSELEFDYQMGKLSAEDYQALRNKYEQQAVKLLKELDRLKQA